MIHPVAPLCNNRLVALSLEPQLWGLAPTAGCCCSATTVLYPYQTVITTCPPLLALKLPVSSPLRSLPLPTSLRRATLVLKLRTSIELTHTRSAPRPRFPPSLLTHDPHLTVIRAPLLLPLLLLQTTAKSPSLSTPTQNRSSNQPTVLLDPLRRAQPRPPPLDSRTTIVPWPFFFPPPPL
jgi:hypothetical protein